MARLEKGHITEAFLQFIWEHRLYQKPLVDLDGEVIEILDPGIRNRDAGPDFFNARIRTAGITWAGNVELHVRASEWYLHGHHHDPAYNNVILHVVLEADCTVNNNRFEQVPAACLGFGTELYRTYRDLLLTDVGLPCREKVKQVDLPELRSWFRRLLEERNLEKAGMVGKLLRETRGNRKEVMYLMLARAFGQQVNALPFEMLARSVPLSLIRKHAGNRMQIEALYFGQSGLLPAKSIDVYTRRLIKRYTRFRVDYGLRPIEGHLWKFLRLRPLNFPGIRISQFAGLMASEKDLIGSLASERQPWTILLNFEFKTSRYWENHFVFGKKSRDFRKHPGCGFIQRLILNAVLPFYFGPEILRGRVEIMNEWADILTNMPSEDNHFTRIWRNMGMDVSDGFSSQAVLQLMRGYCRPGRCLSCYIGNTILSGSRDG